MKRNERPGKRRAYEPPTVSTLSAREVIERLGPAMALYGLPPNFFGEEWG